MYRIITVLIFTSLLFISNILIAQTQFNISNRTSGDTLLTVDDQGRVGIGTTAPGADLEVKSDAPENGAFISVGNSDDTNFLLMYGCRGGASSLSPGVYLGDTSPLRFVSCDGAYNELRRLSELGNLGIGIDDPFAKLDVQMSGTGPWQRGIRLLNPDLDIGNRLLLTIGKYDTPFNAANIYFNFQGEDSDQNRLSLGLFNVSDVLNIIGTGKVEIGTTNPSIGLELAGTIYSSSGGFRFPDGSVQTSAAGGGGTAGSDYTYGYGGVQLHTYMDNTVWVDRNAGNINGYAAIPYFYVSDAQIAVTTPGRIVFLEDTYPEPITLNKANIRYEAIGSGAVLGD